MKAKHSDNPKALTKQKELAVHQAFKDAGIQFEYQHHLPFRGCGLASETRCAYPDFVIYKPWGVIILEVDESQHTAYDASCDVRRDFDMVASIALGSAQKLVILRFNPDSYKIAGQIRRTATKERHETLIKTINEMEEPVGFRRLFLFYDKDSDDARLPSIAKEWDPAAREVSNNV